MQKSVFLACLLVLLQLPVTVSASQLVLIPLAELPERAELTVLGDVYKVVTKGDQDIVTVRVASVIQGKTTAKKLTFALTCRGGLKDFDPKLKVGDMGVFFLKSQSKKKAKKAYWGSVAIFPKPAFHAGLQ